MDRDLSLLFAALSQEAKNSSSETKKPSVALSVKPGEKVTPENVVPGLRVTRGPDWTLGKQDGLDVYIGTVLQSTARGYWTVLWDHDPDNIYSHFVSRHKSELSIAQEHPIVVTTTNFLPGAYVTRGPHWSWGNEDGGSGKYGILVELIGDSWCFVFWSSSRTLQSHRIGHKGHFDLAIISLPEKNTPVPLGPYTAIPGLPVVRGPHWELGDTNGEPDSYGYLLEETKNGWMVYWPVSKELSVVPKGKVASCPLAYCPWGYHKPIESALGISVSDKFHVIVNASNVFVGANVLKSNLEGQPQPGKIIGVDLIDKTCRVQFSESVVSTLEIGKSNFYKLFFANPVDMNRWTIAPSATPDRIRPGIRVKIGPDFRSEYIQYPEEAMRLCGTVDMVTHDRSCVGVKWDLGSYGTYRATASIADLTLVTHDDYYLCRINPSNMDIDERVVSGFSSPTTNIPPFTFGLITAVPHDPVKSITILWENGIQSTIPVSQALDMDIFSLVSSSVTFYSSKILQERLSAVIKQVEASTSEIASSSPSLSPLLGSNIQYYSNPDPNVVPEKEITLGYQICTGSMGRVFECHLFGRRSIAKEIKKSEIPSPNVDDTLVAELNNLRKLRHPFLLRPTALSISESRFLIVYENMESGSIRDVINETSNLDTKTIIQLASRATQGLAYLHANDIIHRNLTSNNILVDRNYNIRIADYGFDVTRSYLIETRFTPKKECYLAPEIRTKQGYTEKIDIYALGIVFWEMDTRLIPTITPPAPFLAKDIAPSDPASFPDIYVRCAAPDPNARPTASDLIEHLRRIASNPSM